MAAGENLTDEELMQSMDEADRDGDGEVSMHDMFPETCTM